MRMEIKSAWEKALASRLSEDELDRFSEQIQDEIFERRARHPLIFNWINSLARTSQEPGMNTKAKEMVAAVLSAKELPHHGAD